MKSSSARQLACAVALGFLGLGNIAQAGLVWFPPLNSTAALTIESYGHFYNNSYDSVLRVKFKQGTDEKGAAYPVFATGGCAPTDAQSYVGHWNPTSSLGFQQMLMSNVISAMAQNQKVRVLYRDDICDTANNAGVSVGRRMEGLMIVP